MGINISPIDYGRWNEALACNFYKPENKGKPVFLNVDDKCIAEIGGKFDLNPDDSISSFISAVKGRIYRPHEYSFDWFVTSKRFFEIQKQGYPPYIGLLGLLVLAASRMSTQKEYSSSNYYKQLEAILGEKNH